MEQALPSGEHKRGPLIGASGSVGVSMTISWL